MKNIIVKSLRNKENNININKEIVDLLKLIKEKTKKYLFYIDLKKNFDGRDDIKEINIFGIKNKIKHIEEEIIELKNQVGKLILKYYGDEIKNFAILTQGYSGRDIKNIINILSKKILIDGKEINFNLFFDSLEEFLLGKEKKIKITNEELYRIGVHELGHAIIGYLNGKKILKVAIGEKDISLGQTFSIEEEEKLLKDKKYFISEIRQLLGGRYGELTILGNYSIGASNDYERATKLAINFFIKNMEYKTNDGKKLKIGLLINNNFDNLPSKIQNNILEYSKILIEEQEKYVYKELNKRKKLIEEYGKKMIKHKILIGEELNYFLKKINK